MVLLLQRVDVVHLEDQVLCLLRVQPERHLVGHGLWLGVLSPGEEDVVAVAAKLEGENCDFGEIVSPPGGMPILTEPSSQTAAAAAAQPSTAAAGQTATAAAGQTATAAAGQTATTTAGQTATTTAGQAAAATTTTAAAAAAAAAAPSSHRMVLAVEYIPLLPVWPVAPVEEHVVRPGGLGLDGLEGGHEGGGVLAEAGQRGHGEGGAQVVVVLGRERARHLEHEAAVAAVAGIWSGKKSDGEN